MLKVIFISVGLFWCGGGLVPFVLLAAIGVLSELGDYINWSNTSSMGVGMICLTAYLVPSLMVSPAKHSLTSLGSVILLILTLVLVFSVNSVVLFYISFEVVLIPITLIVMGWGPQPERLIAGVYMMFYTLVSALPFMLMVISMAQKGFHLVWSGAFSWGSWVVLMPFMVKTPVYLVHLWLPKAHVEAPVYGSMVLAGILLKLGSYGVWRVGMWVSSISVWVCIVGVGGMIASMVCFMQLDVKLLVAYSSIVHMALSTSCLMVGESDAVVWVLFMLLGHGLCSVGLFYLVSCLFYYFGSRSMLCMQGGVLSTPMLFTSMVMLILMNSSVPPSVTLVSEVYMSGVLMGLSGWWVVAFGVTVIMGLVFSVVLINGVMYGPYSSMQPKSVPFVWSVVGWVLGMWWWSSVFICVLGS